MAEKFNPQTFNINSINNGDKYNLGDGVSNEAVNAPIEAAAYAQALATNQPNIENAGLVGAPTVSIEEVDGLPRFKFENLKGADGKISVQYVTNIDTILPWPDSRPTGNFIPGIPYIYPVYITMSGSHIALYQYDPTTDTMTFLEELRENVLYYVAEGEKKGIYYALPSVSHNKFYPATITDGDFKLLKQDVEILEGKTADINVKTSSNTAKIENLTNILLDNEQVAIAEVEQAFTTRQTADGENIIDEQNVFPKLIKGSTVKSANLIPYPYAFSDATENGITYVKNNDGGIKFTGTATVKSYVKLCRFNLGAFSVGTYYISGSGNYTNVQLLVDAYLGGKWVKELKQGNGKVVVDFDGYDSLSVFAYVDNGMTVDFTLYPMLNEGSTALPFRPYFSGLKNAYLQSVKSTGRNLFNKAMATMNYGLAVSTGWLYGDNTYFTSDFIPVKPNTAYKIGTTNESTWWGCCYDTNKKYIGQAKTNATNKTLLSIEGAVYLRFCEKKEVLDTLMLNEGNTALPFEPYVKDTFILPETLELGEWDKYDPQTGILARWTGYATSEAGFTEEEIASYRDAIVSLDGKTLAYNLALPPRPIIYKMRATHYKAWNGGSETQEQGETDNSADGAMCTLTNDYFVKVGGATNEQTE